MRPSPALTMIAGAMAIMGGLANVFGGSDDAMIVAGAILIAGGLIALRITPTPKQ